MTEIIIKHEYKIITEDENIYNEEDKHIKDLVLIRIPSDIFLCFKPERIIKYKPISKELKFSYFLPKIIKIEEFSDYPDYRAIDFVGCPSSSSSSSLNVLNDLSGNGKFSASNFNEKVEQLTNYSFCFYKNNEIKSFKINQIYLLKNIHTFHKRNNFRNDSVKIGKDNGNSTKAESREESINKNNNISHKIKLIENEETIELEYIPKLN